MVETCLAASWAANHYTTLCRVFYIYALCTLVIQSCLLGDPALCFLDLFVPLNCSFIVEP